MGKITRHEILEVGQLRLLKLFCFSSAELSCGYLQTVRRAKRLSLGVAGDHRQTRMAQTMEGILEVLNEGVGITDDTGHVLLSTSAWSDFLALARDTHWKGRRCFYSGKRIRVHVGEKGSNEGWWLRPIRILRSHADGTRVPVIISARELAAPDGSPFLVFTCTDISQQKKAEQNLREQIAQLKNRADEMTRAGHASRVQESLGPQPFTGTCASETFYKPVRTIGGISLVIPFRRHSTLIARLRHFCHGISSACGHLFIRRPFRYCARMEPDENAADSKSLCDRRHQGRCFTFTMVQHDWISVDASSSMPPGHPPAS